MTVMHKQVEIRWGVGKKQIQVNGESTEQQQDD